LKSSHASPLILAEIHKDSLQIPPTLHLLSYHTYQIHLRTLQMTLQCQENLESLKLHSLWNQCSKAKFLLSDLSNGTISTIVSVIHPLFSQNYPMKLKDNFFRKSSLCNDFPSSITQSLSTEVFLYQINLEFSLNLYPLKSRFSSLRSLRDALVRAC